MTDEARSLYTLGPNMKWGIAAGRARYRLVSHSRSLPILGSRTRVGHMGCDADPTLIEATRLSTQRCVLPYCHSLSSMPQSAANGNTKMTDEARGIILALAGTLTGIGVGIVGWTVNKVVRILEDIARLKEHIFGRKE